VTNGQKADLVNFSVGSDMTKLVPGQVDADWNTGPTKGARTSANTGLRCR
jgi:ABC-type sulfate transport system substrate-binding protein